MKLYIQFYYSRHFFQLVPQILPRLNLSKQAAIQLLTMNRRSHGIKIKSELVGISPQQSQEQRCPEEETLPFKPFYMKFMRLKTNLTPRRYNKEEDDLNCSVKNYQLRSNRMLTEGQTNDFYVSDFQTESESLSFRESVPEQNQILPSTASLHYSQLPSDIFNQQTQTQHTSAFLRKRNRQLIEYIQYLRQVLPIFQANILALRNQKHELQKVSTKLYDQRDKVFDYSYELRIDQSQHRNMTASKVQKTSIKQCSAVFEKQKYLSVREALRKANPTVFEIHYSSESMKKPKRLSVTQQDLIAKKRQYYKYSQKLQSLQEKINEYVQKLDAYESILSRGDDEKLLTRKRNLENEIESKRTEISIKEIELNLQITNFNNQLAAVDARLIEINKQKQLMKEKIFEFRHNNQSTLVRSSKKQYFPKEPTTHRIYSLKHKKPIALTQPQETSPGTPTAIQQFVYRYKKGACQNAQGSE